MGVKRLTLAMMFCCSLIFTFASVSTGQEVEKGKIPASDLDSSLRKLSWNAAIWDIDEALVSLKSKEKALWIDTRPLSFFEKGTVRGAVSIPYNKSGADGNELNKEILAKAVAEAGLDSSTAKIVFFCQGPKCHRSYNASFVAITEWGYSPEQIVWFRAGYPYLLKALQDSPKLKRKAKKYISAAGIKQL